MENDNPYAVSYDDTSPDKQIRTDLWPTMGMPELVVQRDLLLTRMEKASRMFGQHTSPSAINIYSAMQVALRDINGLIDHQTKK